MGFAIEAAPQCVQVLPARQSPACEEGMLLDRPWEEVAAYLDRCRTRRPQLAELLAFQEAILLALYRNPASPDLSGTAGPWLAERNPGGQPVLERRGFVLDLPAAERLFWELGMLLKGRGAGVQEAVETIEAAVRSGLLQLGELLRGVLVQDGYAEKVGERQGWSADPFAFWAAAAVRPSGEACARSVGAWVDPDKWSRSVCPVCGSPPKFGELRGQELAATRYLHCGFCGWAWPYRRSGCPFCGNTDHRSLNLLLVEEDRRCNLEVCEACRRYLKVVDGKEFFDVIPSLEDLATPHLDVIALERGYR